MATRKGFKDLKDNPAIGFINTDKPEAVTQDLNQAKQNVNDLKQAAGLLGYKLVQENKSERMQLLVRPALKEKIRSDAAEKGLSMNNLINCYLEEIYERKENK